MKNTNIKDLKDSDKKLEKGILYMSNKRKTCPTGTEAFVLKLNALLQEDFR